MYRLPNGSTFSRKPREHTTANLNYPHARIGGCNVVFPDFAAALWLPASCRFAAARGNNPFSVRQLRLPKHEPYMAVDSNDLLDNVKERLALTSLGLCQTRLHVGYVRWMARAEVLS